MRATARHSEAAPRVQEGAVVEASEQLAASARQKALRLMKGLHATYQSLMKHSSWPSIVNIRVCNGIHTVFQ